MPLEDRDRSIIAQNANNVAAPIIAAAISAGQIQFSQAAGYLASLTEEIQAVTYANFGQQTVSDVLPGTVQADAQVIPHPANQQPVQNQPQQPAPIPGVQDNPEDALWRELVEHPENWWDNRNDKRNPKAPDFKHKTKKEGQYNVGLWLKDKPAWVTNY